MSPPAPKRQRRILGGIYRIALGDGTFAYCQALAEAEFVFFELRDEGDAAPSEVAGRNHLFRIAIHKSAWDTGRWSLIGMAPIAPDLQGPVPKFVQDPIKPDKFSIYLGGRIRPASREECAGLERSAVWDPEHVEDRIRDHYAGASNKWVESQRLK
jgi:immunity protein 26 of polymorphic toxin system